MSNVNASFHEKLKNMSKKEIKKESRQKAHSKKKMEAKK